MTGGENKEATFSEENHTSYELLNDWKSGLLSKEMEVEILAHLSECEQCSTVYEGLKLVLARQEKDPDATKDFLKSVLEKQQQLLDSQVLEPHKRTRTFSWRMGLGIAASISALLVLFSVFWNTQTPEELVKAYLAEGYRSPVVDRASTGEEDLQLAFEFYASKEFEKASRYFEQLTSSDAVDFRASFYLGICYLQQDVPDYTQAIENLSSSLDVQSRYEEQSRWFLSLTYFQNGELESAKKLLFEISARQQHFKKSEAEEFLESL